MGTTNGRPFVRRLLLMVSIDVVVVVGGAFGLVRLSLHAPQIF